MTTSWPAGNTSDREEPVTTARAIQTPLYVITIAMIFIGLFAFGAVLFRAV